MFRETVGEYLNGDKMPILYSFDEGKTACLSFLNQNIKKKSHNQIATARWSTCREVHLIFILSGTLVLVHCKINQFCREVMSFSNFEIFDFIFCHCSGVGLSSCT